MGALFIQDSIEKGLKGPLRREALFGAQSPAQLLLRPSSMGALFIRDPIEKGLKGPLRR